MPNKKGKFKVGQIFTSIIVSLLFIAVILFLAGDWFWIEGWVFIVFWLTMTLSIGIYLSVNDPELLAERSKMPGSDNQKGWDKYYQSFAYVSLIAWVIIMPLDAKRYAWSPYFPVWLKAIGGVALLPSLYFLFQSVATNTFASTMVRIQTERKQHVISTGVYGFVRHPMYLGNLLMLVGTPLMLGSIYGLIIGLIGIFLMAVRIIGEERMLINELEGYEDYKKKIRYRLIPFVW
ncbi:Isoprenylcysteine carboxyl methyltransferase [Desulfofarcimen acetoxidans DSM 771]|uniref:Isoprenylcysteine carboxyl methyltransferase n=1 Tax=Desulfofarcimen acetoxidans (strain ATCC 49208 / DSM 771 / KCTC 5769 / VKM B-1644 / 5575) TaxID=485916 RepID=C8W602_DESAS|nr:isoprenylcysteine carboxylmethyltransferase family protein [Desulfofarcimen acetoxidans]ACV61457.1 Isoprenylcysteine carboxyl methyltransferase [Desulfofarcimen acetoxidans DSM 771]